MGPLPPSAMTCVLPMMCMHGPPSAMRGRQPILLRTHGGMTHDGLPSCLPQAVCGNAQGKLHYALTACCNMFCEPAALFANPTPISLECMCNEHGRLDPPHPHVPFLSACSCMHTRARARTHTHTHSLTHAHARPGIPTPPGRYLCTFVLSLAVQFASRPKQPDVMGRKATLLVFAVGWVGGPG